MVRGRGALRDTFRRLHVSDLSQITGHEPTKQSKWGRSSMRDLWSRLWVLHNRVIILRAPRFKNKKKCFEKKQKTNLSLTRCHVARQMDWICFTFFYSKNHS